MEKIGDKTPFEVEPPQFKEGAAAFEAGTQDYGYGTLLRGRRTSPQCMKWRAEKIECNLID